MALFVTGDIHGNAYDLAARARAAGAGRGDEVLVLGDVSLAYGQDERGTNTASKGETAPRLFC